jgi:hypothetical protein
LSFSVYFVLDLYRFSTTLLFCFTHAEPILWMTYYLKLTTNVVHEQKYILFIILIHNMHTTHCYVMI